jgi:hypothetical protein
MVLGKEKPSGSKTMVRRKGALPTYFMATRKIQVDFL